MHRSRLGAVIIDCRTDDLSVAADFWTAALGYDPAAEQSDDRYVELKGPGTEVAISLQKVEHASRLHLDIETDDVEAEVKRLTALGAKEVARMRGYMVLQAPTGHRFCVVKPQRADFPAGANRYD